MRERSSHLEPANSNLENELPARLETLLQQHPEYANKINEIKSLLERALNDLDRLKCHEGNENFYKLWESASRILPEIVEKIDILISTIRDEDMLSLIHGVGVENIPDGVREARDRLRLV